MGPRWMLLVLMSICSSYAANNSSGTTPIQITAQTVSKPRSSTDIPTVYVIAARALDHQNQTIATTISGNTVNKTTQRSAGLSKSMESASKGTNTSTASPVYTTAPDFTTATEFTAATFPTTPKKISLSLDTDQDTAASDLLASATALSGRNRPVDSRADTEDGTGEDVIYARIRPPSSFIPRPISQPNRPSSSYNPAADAPVVFDRPSTGQTERPGPDLVFLKPGSSRPNFGRPTVSPDRPFTSISTRPTHFIANRPVGDKPYPPVPDVAFNNNNAGASWGKPNRWDTEKNKAVNMLNNMTRVTYVEADCLDDVMKIRIRFNGSFVGLIYSSSYSYDTTCMYVNGTGREEYEFFIKLNRCGTLGGNTHTQNNRKEPSKNFMWNTLSVQYNPLIEEEWDEHFKVTCEYGYDFWKTVTFPFLDVEVATGNPLSFTLSPPECHMEIRGGYGITGSRITGPVRVGDPLTLIIYMRSRFDGFDLIVSDCYAHNGANKRIQLIDHSGCPVDEKLISRFRGTWTDSGLYETQVFAYMKAFRFTGSPALYIECDVRMCHGHCPNQPCYWRNAREINKRDVRSVEETSSLETRKEADNSSLSENLNLFQALQVLVEDEMEKPALESTAGVSGNTSSESFCLRAGTWGAIAGIGALVYVALGLFSCLMCVRLRRRKDLSPSMESFQTYATTGTLEASKRPHFY